MAAKDKENAGEKPKRSKLKIIFIILVLIFLMIGGGGCIMLLPLTQPRRCIDPRTANNPDAG